MRTRAELRAEFRVPKPPRASTSETPGRSASRKRLASLGRAGSVSLWVSGVEVVQMRKNTFGKTVYRLFPSKPHPSQHVRHVPTFHV